MICLRIASPTRGVIVLFIAWALGRVVAQWSAPKADATIAIETVIGFATLAALYGVFAFLGFQPFFPIVAWALGAAAVFAAKSALRRCPAPSLSSVVLLIASLLLAGYASYFVDRLPLHRPHVSGFAWIDTSLWLSIAYGLERALPVPDLLFKDGIANYHFGFAFLPVILRSLTGLPMHSAYVVGLFACILAAMYLLRDLLADRMGKRSAPCGLFWLATPMIGLIWTETHIQNFPSVVATPLMLSLMWWSRHLQGVRTALVHLLLLALCVLTKEVLYVYALVFAGTLWLWQDLPARHWKRLAFLVAAFLATRWFGHWLTRPDQNALLDVTFDHVSRSWLFSSINIGSAAGAVLLLAIARWKRWLPDSLQGLLLQLVCVCGAGTLLYVLVIPRFDPPMDPFSYKWILFDMSQFESEARYLTTASLFACLALMIDRSLSRTGGAARVAVISIALISLVATFNHNMWKIRKPGPQVHRPEYRGPDDVVNILKGIDPATALIAADHLNWNEENPHWAAFFGHRFYRLRLGRWTTAYANYKPVLQNHEILFRGTDKKAALGVLASEGITHIIEKKTEPIQWLGAMTPDQTTEIYNLYAAARLGVIIADPTP